MSLSHLTYAHGIPCSLLVILTSLARFHGANHILRLQLSRTLGLTQADLRNSFLGSPNSIEAKPVSRHDPVELLRLVPKLYIRQAH